MSLTGTPAVTLSGAHAADFSVSRQPTTPVGAAGSTTFQVSFVPSARGLRTAELSIASNDGDESPFNFALQGLGLTAGDVDSLDAGVDGTVLATAVQPDGKTIIAGGFTYVQGVRRDSIARLNADWTLDMGFDPNPLGLVYCVALLADGKILLGGDFTSFWPNKTGPEMPRSRIARLYADGTVDAGFDPKANNSVQSVVVQADGKVLLGGYFTTLQPNGTATTTTRNRIARLNADGTLDASFNPNANSVVRSVAVQADGRVLLCGWFTTLQPNGLALATTRNRIARVNADGTLDAGFNPNANYYVNCMALQANGKVLLGGEFTTLQPNGAASVTTRNRVARVNADGTMDAGFDPNANDYVFSMAMQADGKVLFTGGFNTLQPNGAFPATTRNRIARLNANGSLDTAFNPNADSVVQCVAVQADGKVLLGGQFASLQPNGAASAILRRGFARLENDPATQSLTTSSAGQVNWTRGGSSPELWRVTFDLSTDSGATWAALGVGARVGATPNWELTGLALPACGQLRARGVTSGGILNGSSGLIEQVSAFPLLTGYATWAATNIPGGQDATFPGDWNKDGIPNGVQYVFGTTRLNPTGRGSVFAPPAIPADVDVYLDRSTNLTASPGWAPVASWVNAAAPVFASGVTLVTGEIRDTIAAPRAFYRYRVVKR